MTTSTKKLSKEEFVQIMMENQKKRKEKENIRKEIISESKERNISEQQKFYNYSKPVDKKLKLNDYVNQILMPMIKKFNKLTEPPFPRNHQEYIYNQQDLDFVLNQIHNNYLKVRDIPNWGECYGKELYLSID